MNLKDRHMRLRMVKKELKFGDVAAAPGQLRCGYIRGVELDFMDFDIPVMLANGLHDGPTLSITAAVHGTEIIGGEIIRRILREQIDIKELHGAVIAVPVSNILGFTWHEHVTPHDGVNMAQVFPGDPNGSLTRRLAHKIWTEVVLSSQYNIDIHHCGGPPAMPYVWCKSEIARNVETSEKALGMAKAVGLTLLHQGKDPFWGPSLWGSLTDATMMKGIPSVTIELDAPMGRVPNTIVEVGVRGTLNAMKYLKMIPGEIEKHPEDVHIIPGEFVMKASQFPRTTRGGVMIIDRSPGEFIARGETIATVYDIFGEKLEEVKMPVDGYVWSYSSALVHEGSVVAYVFGKWDPESMRGFKVPSLTS